MNRLSRVAMSMRTAGRGAFYVVMGACFVSFVVLGVTSWLGKDRPIHWGTFQTTSVTCDSGPRRVCTTRGIWTSDDGQITRSDVILDGSADKAGTARASYQPGGAMGDDENNVVHTAAWTNAGLWFPWVAAACIAGTTASYARKWRGATTDRSLGGAAVGP